MARAIALSPIVIAPHLLAGATAELTAIIAVMIALSATITLLTIDRVSVPAGTRELVGLFAVLLAWSGLQAMPLPCDFIASWLGASRVSAPLAVAQLTGSAAYCSVSVDPGLTATAIMQGASCLVTFMVCAIHVASGNRRDVMRAVSLAGATVALSALMHLAYDAERVYGLYQPLDAGRKPFGPIINMNQLAGLCALTMPSMVALTLEQSDRRTIATWLFAAAMTIAVALMTLSRGGIAAIVLATILCVAIMAAPKGKSASGRAQVAAFMLTAGGIVAWFLVGEAIMREFVIGDASKVSQIMSGMNHALRQGWTGHGRGAFGIAAIDVSAQGEWAHYAESLPVQWVGDYGALIGSIAVVGLGARVVYVMLSRDRVPQQLVAAGLVAFGLSNFVDFGIEMTGIAVVASAALAAASTHSGRAAADTGQAIVARTLVIAGVALSLTLAVTRASTSVERDLELLETSLTANDFVDFDATLAAAIRTHPRNPALALYAAAAARARDANETVPWLNLAMRSAPSWWSPHQEAARFFFQRRRHMQAAHEAKIVADVHTGHGRNLVCELGRRGMRVRHLVRTAPTRGGGAFLASVVPCLPRETGAALDAKLMTWRVPPEASIDRALGALAARPDAEAVVTLTVRARDWYPRSAAMALSSARSLSAVGRTDLALGALARARALDAPVSETSLAEATLHAARRDTARMRAALERYRDSVSGDLDALARAEATSAQLELTGGTASAAVRALERAYALDGGSEHLAAIVSIATGQRWEARALIAKRQLCAAAPEHPLCADED